MSATAFQRLRREQERIRLEQVVDIVDYNKLNKGEIVKILLEKGIKFDGKAKKEELIQLLEGVE